MEWIENWKNTKKIQTKTVEISCVRKCVSVCGWVLMCVCVSSNLDIEHSPYYIALGSTKWFSDNQNSYNIIYYEYIYLYQPFGTSSV